MIDIDKLVGRILWITQYDGSNCLDSVSRVPVAEMPEMPGG
jgi:hypothetical protein